MPKFTIEFDETGGYDCCYGTWDIRENKNIVVSVSQRHYGQIPCDYDFRSERAEQVARIVYDALVKEIN